MREVALFVEDYRMYRLSVRLLRGLPTSAISEYDSTGGMQSEATAKLSRS